MPVYLSPYGTPGHVFARADTEPETIFDKIIRKEQQCDFETKVLGQHKSMKVAHCHLCSTWYVFDCVCHIGCMPLHNTCKLVAVALCVC